LEDFFTAMAGWWPPGREDYCWHVLPGSTADRERLAGSFRELTERPGLVPVRPEWMHVAVWRLGPASGITGRELARMGRLAQGRCEAIAPFSVTVGRPEAWEAALACPVRSGYRLRFLRQMLAEAAGVRLGPEPLAYCPHLTAAFAVAYVDQGPVRAWLSDSEVAETELLVARLVLVAQQHDGREITWRVIDEVELSGSMR
jgi:2'-5' RNA ligase